jgi:uncharacterized protein (TIGR00106 family)
MAIVEVSVVPVGVPTTSLSRFVAQVVGVLQEYPKLSYTLTPMGTVIEGDLDRVLEAVRRMHEVPFDRGIHRVLTRLSIDDRRDKKSTLRTKVDSVLRKLAE